MSFAFSNEEEDDFGTLSNNSNLASIFHDPGVQLSSSKSLVYTAPKQPSGQQKPTSTGVVAAVAVTCYKLANEKYEALPGKIGLALLSENETNTYRMILYQNKQKPLATAKISKDFIISSQPENFCTFYDDNQQNWAILFDSKEIAQRFLGEVDQMKNMLTGQNKHPVKQVKDVVDGPLLTSNSVETATQNQESSNKTKLISRIAKLGQPILPLSGAIVADELSDSEQAPAVQSSPEQEQPPERMKPKKATRPVPTLIKPIAQPPVDYNNTFNSMVVPSHQYNQMMSGQPAYPMQMQFLPPTYTGGNTNNNTHHFDTLMSENRMNSSEVRMHLCRLTDKIDLLLQKSGVPESHSKDRNPIFDEAQFDVFTKNLQKLQGQSNENSNKLDLILKEMSASSSKTKNHDNPAEEVERLLASERTAWLASRNKLDGSIQQLRQENEQLIHQIREVSDREKENDARIQQLKEENVRLKDVIATAGNIDDASVIQLKEENIRLTNLIDASMKKEEHLASQQHETQEKLEYYEAKWAEANSHMLEFKSLTEDKDRKLSELKEQLQKLERECSHARSLVETLQLKLKETEEVQKKSQISDKDSVEEQVKNIMNKVYKEIMKQFKPDESYALQSIKSTVSVVIRDVTLTVLHGEPTVNVSAREIDASVDTATEEVSAKEDDASTIPKETEDNLNSATEVANNIQTESESKERSISFLETLQSSLAAASLQNEQAWKPDPPPPPLFDDFDNEDDWLV